MFHYRLYILDGVGDRILQVREFEASADEQAIALAEDARGLVPMELWNGSRLVRRINPRRR